MSEGLKKLREMSDDEIIEEHDKKAENTIVGINHYLAEILRREQHRQTDAMLIYTKKISKMTYIMMICTIVNIILTAVIIFKR